MRARLATIATLVVVLALAISASALAPVQAQVPTENWPRTISVVGTGQAEVSPDQAVVVVGVETRAETAGDALEQNNEQMNEVMAALEDAGLAAEDIQTQTVQLQPIYEQPSPQEQVGPQVAGYLAVNTVEITVRDLDQLGDIMDEAISAGGNTIQGIQFLISDPTSALDQALEAAWNDAMAKAERLTNLAGAELGEVFSITQANRVSSIAFPRGAAVAEAAVPIAPGTETVETELQVTWFLDSAGQMGQEMGGEQPTAEPPVQDVLPTMAPPASPIATPVTGPEDVSIRLQPAEGGPDVPVRIEGTGFPPNETVSVHLAQRGTGITWEDYGQTVADANGVVSLLFIMPGEWPNGEAITDGILLVVVATEDLETAAQATFEYRQDAGLGGEELPESDGPALTATPPVTETLGLGRVPTPRAPTVVIEGEVARVTTNGVIHLTQPVNGYDQLQLIDQSIVRSAGGEPIPYRTLEPGTRIEASGWPGLATTLVTETVRVLE